MPICSSTFLMFMATLAALTLLVLVIFSEPFIHMFYFLRTSAEGGVRFGVLGYCLEQTGVCVTKPFSYTFQPELITKLPMVLVLYPIAAGFALIGAIVLVPIFFSRWELRWPYSLFGFLSAFAFLSAAAALGITLWLFIVAMKRFHAVGLEASFGPSLWIAVAATALLFLIAINAGCGTFMGGRFGRQARHLAYTY